jgi:hypothetical protein
MKEMFHDNGSRARERATELIVILERGPELSDYLKSRLRVSGRSGKLSRKKIGQTRPVADVEQPEKKIKVEMELKKRGWSDGRSGASLSGFMAVLVRFTSYS